MSGKITAQTLRDPAQTTDELPINRGGLDGKVTAGSIVSALGREKLTANRTYYVDGSLGNDANTGLSSGAGAFQTIQHAVNVVGGIDHGVYQSTINVADGTYSESALTVSLPILIGGLDTSSSTGIARLLGNTGTPANVVVNGFGALSTIGWEVRGFKVADFDGIGANVTAQRHSVLRIGELVLQPTSSFDVAIDSAYGSVILIRGPITFDNGGGGANVFLGARNQSQISVGDDITVTGTPALGSAFAQAVQVSLIVSTGTITGAATGVRYNVESNAAIDTGGSGGTYFPGNVAGTTSTGGQYL